MSNPTGDALVAIGIKDTQKLSGRIEIHRALVANARKRSAIFREDLRQILLGIAIAMIVVTAFVI